jgi:uncharacterized protein
VSRPPAARLVTLLGLAPHPEGGYYREIHRSPNEVSPADGRGRRSSLTTIYFLLPADAVSRWHRVSSDEVWHHYEGAPLTLSLVDPALERERTHRLGPLGPDCEPVAVAPAGWWQAARSTGEYTLVGCTVAPGFSFDDFTLLADQPEAAAALRAHHPHLAPLL